MTNQIISAARYNNLQARVGNLLGVGTGNIGYNQAVSSSQVPIESVVTATEMNQIYADLVKVRTHQNGSEPTGVIKQVNNNATPTLITTGTFINTGNNNVVTIVTATDHKLIDGVYVDTITGVVGMTQLNGLFGFAKVLSSTTFELYQNYDRTSGTPFTNPIGSPSFGSYISGGQFTHTISEESYYSYESLTTTCENAKFNVDFTQADPAVKATSQRTALWGGTATPQSVYHEFTVTFTTANARRGFFNAGGELRFSASLANLPSGSSENYQKSVNWQSMLSNMGTIKFNHTETFSTLSSGTGSSIGNYDLTSAYQTVYTKAGSSVYTENDYVIKIKSNSATQLQVRLEFNDSDVGSGGADERVEGTLDSTLTEYRATGPYVQNESPTITSVTEL